MTVRPGRNSIVVAGILAVASAGSFFWTPLATAPLFGLTLLLLAAEVERRKAKTLLLQTSVSRNLPTVIARGKTFDSTLVISNPSSVAIEVLIRDVVSASCHPPYAPQTIKLAPKSSETIVQKYRISVRGRHQFGPVWIVLVGPNKLVDVQQSIHCTGSIKVLPETFAGWEELAKDTKAAVELLNKASRLRHHGVCTEFESLYAFRQGDDPRRIDWRATARMRQPIVRRFQVERHRDVMILVDSGRLMGSQTQAGSKLDCAVDAALNLCRVALQSGDRCGIAAYDSKVRGFLPPVAGIQSLNSIVDCVFDLQTQWRESDFSEMHAALQTKQSKRSLLVVLSDLSDTETSQLQCAALQKLSQRHLVLFVALRTPLLKQLIHEPIESVVDAAKHAVTYRLLRERNQALHVLERAGVHVLDVEPQQVTVPLINQFVQLRERNLL